VLIRIFSKIGFWSEDKDFQKVLECTSSSCTLKASILNPGIIFVVCCLMCQRRTSFPYLHEVSIISCGDMIMLMSA
jgi:hypothetical protein